MIVFDSSDLLVVEKMTDIVKRGRYLSGGDVTKLHNKLFKRNLRVTNCASCIKHRYDDIKRAYDLFLANLKEAEQEAEQVTTTEEIEPQIKENKPLKRNKKVK